jgi:uroporphyrin-III C-methyltransferase
MNAPLHKGTCALVGAGPGDPDLLTLKAVKCLQQATVVLVDDLVAPAILAHIPASARQIAVGKRGGCLSTPQAFIEKHMIQLVRQGERVVRLKGGDPFVLGRGGEELARLQAEGIEVEVVNGITSGQAALTRLGVPLTHRDHAQGVLFITGHTQPGATGPDWPSVAQLCHQQRITLLIYMGSSRSAHIQAGLLAGLPAHTPVALVQNASRPEQRHAVTTLDALHETLHAEGLGSPCIIAVGDVLTALAALQAQAAPTIRCAA